MCSLAPILHASQLDECTGIKGLYTTALLSQCSCVRALTGAAHRAGQHTATAATACNLAAMASPSKPEPTLQSPSNVTRHVEVLRAGTTDRGRQQALCNAAKALRELSGVPDRGGLIAATGAISVLASILRNNNSSQILLQAATATLRLIHP